MLDLDAYLTRVGVDAEPPSYDALARLQAAHARTFPFDHIDVLLEQHPGVALPAVVEKFVGRGRGGYCFEHATLFHAVVRALGYDATLRLARVGDPQAAPRTHLGVVVTLDGVRHLADPGIGVPPLAPIPLVDGAVLPGGIWDHEVRQVAEGPSGPGWQLWRRAVVGMGADAHHRRAAGARRRRRDGPPLDQHRTPLALPAHLHRRPPRPRRRRHPDPDHGDPRRRDRQRRAGSPSTQRPFDLDELPDLMDRLGANLTADELARLRSRLVELS